MRTGNVAPKVGHFNEATTKPTKNSDMQDKLNKLANVAPAQRPQTTRIEQRRRRSQSTCTDRTTTMTNRTLPRESPT